MWNWTTGKKSETRLLDNETGYCVFSGMPPVVVNGMQLDAMQLQLMHQKENKFAYGVNAAMLQWPLSGGKQTKGQSAIPG